MRRFFLYIIILTTIAGFSPASLAQFFPKAVSLSANPTSPSPGETVAIEALTPLFDKNEGVFAWKVNGIERPDLSGMGKYLISLSAGRLGASMEVSVIITRKNGPGGQASLSIPIVDLALTWVSDTRIPKWYRGKALPIPESIVSVIAIPGVLVNNARIPPKNLIYKWSLDDEINALSGIGQDVFRIKMSPFAKQTYRVNLVVEDTGKKIRKEENIFLTPFSPRMTIYPYSPLGGVEPRQGTGYIFSKKRGLVDFMAETFNMPINSPKDLQYAWKVKNATVVGSPENPELLTLNTGGEQEEQIPLSVTANDPGRKLPSLTNSMFLILE